MAGLISAWDVHNERWWEHYEARSNWLKDRGFPAGDMYRVEFWLIDGPVARIFCYALDENGRPYCGRSHPPGTPHVHPECEAAREAPCDVLLTELPPREIG